MQSLRGWSLVEAVADGTSFEFREKGIREVLEVTRKQFLTMMMGVMRLLRHEKKEFLMKVSHNHKKI